MKSKDTDLAYVAGLFDALGCMKIETPKAGERASLYVWITDKNFKLMEHLQRFGATVGQRSDMQYRAKWRDNKALFFLRSIFPALRSKVEQAKVAIEFMEQRNTNPESKDYDVTCRIRLKLLKRAED